MSDKDFYKRITTFIKADSVGVCPFCNQKIYSDRLYVNEDDKIYHYSCYNEKKADEVNE